MSQSQHWESVLAVSMCESEIPKCKTLVKYTKNQNVLTVRVLLSKYKHSSEDTAALSAPIQIWDRWDTDKFKDIEVPQAIVDSLTNPSIEAMLSCAFFNFAFKVKIKVKF